MLYLARMAVNLPDHLTADEAAELAAAETARAQELQRSGQWRHIWRVVGRTENYSVFDVEDHDALHRLFQSLPFFPHLDIELIALAAHPSALPEGDPVVGRSVIQP